VLGLKIEGDGGSEPHDASTSGPHASQARRTSNFSLNESSRKLRLLVGELGAVIAKRATGDSTGESVMKAADRDGIRRRSMRQKRRAYPNYIVTRLLNVVKGNCPQRSSGNSVQRHLRQDLDRTG